jgi:hypothetical protein
MKTKKSDAKTKAMVSKNVALAKRPVSPKNTRNE